jgi:hypothetical protein
MTASRVINLYDLVDSAYDAPEIKAKSLALGHVPIIDPHPRNVPGGKETIAAEARGRRTAGYALAEDVRYTERSAAERVNGSLKGLPSDVRHPRAGHRSTDAVDHVIPNR